MSIDPASADVNDLRAAIERACQPTFVPYILEGRRFIAAMPREWVISNIEQVGRSALNLDDYWEYGRFLEVLHEIGATDLLCHLVREGLSNSDIDVREIAQTWVESGRVGDV